jgi:hypothetical protein
MTRIQTITLLYHLLEVRNRNRVPSSCHHLTFGKYSFRYTSRYRPMQNRDCSIFSLVIFFTSLDSSGVGCQVRTTVDVQAATLRTRVPSSQEIYKHRLRVHLRQDPLRTSWGRGTIQSASYTRHGSR